MLRRLTDITAILTGILLAAKCIVAVDIPTWVAVGAEMLLLLTVLTRMVRHPEKLEICWPLVAFYAAMAVSFICHLQPLTGERGARLAVLGIGLLCFSPLIVSPLLQSMRLRMAVALGGTLAAMVTVSALVWVWSVIDGGHPGDNRYYYFGFRGVFIYGMALSPAAAVSAVVAAWMAVQQRWHRLRPWLGAYFVIAVLMTIAGGSMSSAAGLGAALLLLAWQYRSRIFPRLHRLTRPAKKMRIALGALAILLALGALPAIFTTFQNKNSRVYTSANGLFPTRYWFWTSRVNEFLSSPLVGVGFDREDLSHTDIPEDVYFGYKPAYSWPTAPKPYRPTESREPGSSWLTVVSFAGLLGGVTFLWFAVWLVRRKGFATVAPLLLFCFFNGCSEGWLLFGGAMMFPIFWLSCSYR